MRLLLTAGFVCILFISKAQQFESEPVTDGQVDVGYQYDIATSAAFDFNREIFLSAGVLPTGITLTDNGDGTADLAGTPTEAGQFDIELTVRLTTFGTTDTQEFTLTIEKGEAEIVLMELSVTYDGTAHMPTAATTPAGLNVNFTFDGVTTAPVDAGSYALVATVEDPNYKASEEDTYIINKAEGTITLDQLEFTYDGDPKTAIISTMPAGLTVDITYDGTTDPPVNAGSYEIEVSIDDANYQGTASGTMTINKATGDVLLSDLVNVFDGDPKPVTVTTTPAGLSHNVTYDGNTEAPSAVGEYEVLATIVESNYAGQASGTLVIEGGEATITFGNLTPVYSGNPQPVTVTTSPAGLDVVITYEGASDPPVNAGAYEVTATIDDENYEGTETATLTIAKAEADITLTDLTTTFDNTPKPVVATTDPAGLTVEITYNGDEDAPVNAGNYDVQASINEQNYQGTASATLIINKAEAELLLSDLNAVYDGNPKPVKVDTDPEGIGVTVTYSGSASPPVSAGSYSVEANVDDDNYMGSATASLIIDKRVATINFSGLSAVFDGDPKPVTVTTSPSGLGVNVTYDGDASAPSEVGSYAVLAEINEQNYKGSRSATLVISNGTAEITLANLNSVYDGKPKEVTATTDPADLPVQITYDGSTDPPVNAGSYSINAFVDDPDYGGSVTGTLVIAKQPAEIFLDNLLTVFDGNPKPVAVETAPAGLSVEVTYDGSLLPPTDPGNYAVLAVIDEQNYRGEASATLTISNDPDANRKPVITNIEKEPLLYKQGTSAIAISETIIINDFDNAEMYEATISISENYTNGDDILTYNNGLNPKITGIFDRETGMMTLSGSDTKSNYETAIANVLYRSNFIGETSETLKELTIVVNDSLANSDPVFRDITIAVSPDIELVNAFTPNGDQINDYWDFINLDQYSEIAISVYNQRGIQVFNCAAADCKWDGTYRGHTLPPGAYLYIIDLDNGKRTYKGVVSILK